MNRGQQLALMAATLFGVISFGVEASARTETLRWTQNEPPAVVGFRVHWRSAGSATTTEDVGRPTRNSQGIFSASVNVADGVDVYFSLTAYDSKGISSTQSNEICRGPGVACGSGPTTPPPTTPPPTTPPPTTPPPTTPPPTGGTPQAALSSFKLWNASNDTVIDSNFTSGESIQTSQYPCVAIEIVGNAYLSNSANTGSVKKQLDSTGGACTTPGVTHENSPPYAWEADEGPNKFACAPSLQVAGAHTLTVTPYDGDDCTGNAGTPVTLQFQVLSPLGAPGQPFLVP
jgi:hypothetical protein